MLISYRQQKTCTSNCNLMDPDKYVSTAHLIVLMHWEQKRKIQTSPLMYMQNFLRTITYFKKGKTTVIMFFFIVTKRRNLIVSDGCRAEGEAFVEVLPFSYLGRRELGESEKRLSCIPNMLREVLAVSKKARTKELEKKKL